MDSENLPPNDEKMERACDSCIKKRARWYCTADDAFLCQTCDATVHSANPLAQRHHRVRLKTASLMTHLSLQVPSWSHGFTKKPRTPRPKYHHHKLKRNPLHLVPQVEDNEEQEQQLIYRVPIFDPFAADVSPSGMSNESCGAEKNIKVGFYEQSDTDVEEFAADVSNLLCKGFDDEESFDMETLGFLDSVQSCSWSNGTVVKFEEEEEEEMKMNYEILDGEIDISKDSFELNFEDYDSPENYEEEDEKVGVGGSVIKLKEECQVMENVVKEKKNKILLALNYEDILAAWPEQKSAWTTGDRPELEDSECWPDCMGDCGKVHHQNYPITYVEMSGMKMDGGREARVSRYREKRRSRLFSKKIRYEVRKINAEKRPRMKGRFVKRATFVAASNQCSSS